MEHVGIVVDDLAAAAEFFVELGLEPQGDGTVEGRWVDRVVGLEGVRVDFAMMKTPDGNGGLELVKFHSPSNQGDNRDAPANTRVSATSHSPSRTSTPSLPACEPAALSLSASWSATRTATGSATSAARRESSSS
jgi:catechol 2,3-dioxygenase-like lactoylglutathione lyase family enzyme